MYEKEWWFYINGIAIIMILAGAIVARVGSSSEKAKEAKAKAELDVMASACRAFYMDTGLWPLYPEDLVSYAEGMGYDDNFIQQPLDATLWRGPYLESNEVPKDPWGVPYNLGYDQGEKVLYVLCQGAPSGIKLLVHIFQK